MRRIGVRERQARLGLRHRLEDAGAGAVAAADAAARRLAGLLGGVRLTARTRGMTWLEQELSS